VGVCDVGAYSSGVLGHSFLLVKRKREKGGKLLREEAHAFFAVVFLDPHRPSTVIFLSMLYFPHREKKD
jgi:hypothetical protein